MCGEGGVGGGSLCFLAVSPRDTGFKIILHLISDERMKIIGRWRVFSDCKPHSASDAQQGMCATVVRVCARAQRHLPTYEQNRFGVPEIVMREALLQVCRVPMKRKFNACQ